MWVGNLYELTYIKINEYRVICWIYSLKSLPWALEWKCGTLFNRFKQKYFTVSTSEGRWDMVSQYIFYEDSTEAKDDSSCILIIKINLKLQVFFRKEWAVHIRISVPKYDGTSLILCYFLRYNLSWLCLKEVKWNHSLKNRILVWHAPG